jgi:hypothetical protein
MQTSRRERSRMTTDLRSGWSNGMFGYWRDGGVFMPIIAGAAPDGDEGNNDDTDDDTDDEEEEEEEDTKDEIKDPVAKLKAEAEKNERLSRKLRKAEEAAADAAKKLKDAEDAKKSDQEKLAERADAAEKLVSDLEKKLDDSVKKLALLDNEDLAGLTAGRRKLVLKLIDMDELEIEDDGSTNADELVAAVKKDAPELFESTDSEDDGDDSDDGGTPKPPKRTANPPKKRKSSQETDRAALEKRMPHLAKHR